MKKAWHIIISVALIVILLGAVFIGVGLITGGDSERIVDVITENPHLQYLNNLVKYFIQCAEVVWNNLFGISSSTGALVMTAG